MLYSGALFKLSYVLMFYFSFNSCIFLLNQGGPAPALVKAEVLWSTRRVNLSEKERVLKTVKG
jgi:hypothetical protein